jgi:recombination protein RecT
MSEIATIQEKPIERLKTILSNESVKEQFHNALGKESNLFVASIIDLYGGDSYLQNCEPKLVVMEALKAATLKLPINKSLGLAYIVPYYKGQELIPQMQVGYKGLIQLAQRTAQYKYINAGAVREGELKDYDKLSGELDISGKAKNELIIGYFAYIETIFGFRKAEYWTVEQVKAHALKYSQSYKASQDPSRKKQKNVIWVDEFDKMAIKTVLRSLIGKYGIISIEFAQVLADDDPRDDDRTIDGEILATDELQALETEVPQAQADDLPKKEF